MRVYIPFDDGSSVSFDGKQFTLHRRPVDLESEPANCVEGKAAEVWARNREALARALESVWILQRERSRQDRTRRVYSRTPSSRSSS